VWSFTRDTTPPAIPSLAGAPVLRVRTAPRVTAAVDDANPSGDAARLLVELCNDPECTAIVTHSFTPDVAIGSVATWQAPALADGVYYLRALAEDSSGNQSAWSDAQQLVIDTSPPSVGPIVAPDDGGVVKSLTLSAAFSSTSAGDTGTVSFEVCANANCTLVVGRGVSGRLASGAVATWAASGLPDGRYFWRVGTEDAAGNDSGWSQAHSFVLDQTPLGRPRGFTAQVAGATLTLHWLPPAGRLHAAGFALIVDGVRTRRISAHTLALRLRLHRGDTRSFAIAAVDALGYAGPPTAAFAPLAQAVKRTSAVSDPVASGHGR